MRPWLLMVLVGCGASESLVLNDIPDRFVELQLKGEMTDEEEGEEPSPTVVGGLGSRGGGFAGGGLAGKKGKSKESSKLLAKFMATTGAVNGMDDGMFANNLEPAEDQAPAALREWFPEAFLWRPSLQTDTDGVASLDVRVPDQLTTWRVLALAHDAQGHQTGTEHTFDSSLPAYVDPVVPAWSYVGDRFDLPVQVVNNSASALSGSLSVDLEGAFSGGMQSQVAMAAFGSSSQRVPVRAVRAGLGVLSAELSGVDRVRKEWQVTPTGRPVVEQLGGALSGERALNLSWPAGADPRTARFQVEVQPGPLAVVLAELQRLDGGGAWGQAYAYGVLHQLKLLSEAVGEPLDEPTLRRVKKRAWQRLVRRARSPSASEAAELLLGLRGEQEGLESALKARLVRTVVEGQRGDGSWSRGQRDTVQSVLVQTAATLRVLPEDQTGPRLRALGALERFQPNINDPYTAAVALASGLEPTEALVELLLSGLVPVQKKHPDGPKTFYAPSRVVNPWGQAPQHGEARAWMALALLELGDEHRGVAGDLVSQLMSNYSASVGFSRGRSGILLEAVVAALPTVGQPIQLSLELDGTTISTASVDPKQPGVPAMMTGVPAGVDPARLTLHSSPASAGLAFTLTQRAWVPWRGDEGLPGVDLEVAQSGLRAGAKGVLEFTLAAPSGARVTLVQGLPSGAVIDGVDALRARSDVRSVEVDQQQVRIQTTAFGAGELRTLKLTVIPRYAGVMVTQPLELISARESVQIAPHVWRVAP